MNQKYISRWTMELIFGGLVVLVSTTSLTRGARPAFGKRVSESIYCSQWIQEIITAITQNNFLLPTAGHQIVGYYLVRIAGASGDRTNLRLDPGSCAWRRYTLRGGKRSLGQS